jgi:hypothetical protein
MSNELDTIVETETETQPSSPSIKRKGRPPGASNNTNYHWHIREKESGKLTSFRTLKEVQSINILYLVNRNIFRKIFLFF